MLRYDPAQLGLAAQDPAPAGPTSGAGDPACTTAGTGGTAPPRGRLAGLWRRLRAGPAPAPDSTPGTAEQGACTTPGTAEQAGAATAPEPACATPETAKPLALDDVALARKLAILLARRPAYHKGLAPSPDELAQVNDTDLFHDLRAKLTARVLNRHFLAQDEALAPPPKHQPGGRLWSVKNLPYPPSGLA